MANIYYLTKKPLKATASYCLTLPENWGFKAGDRVTIETCFQDNPEVKYRMSGVLVYKCGRSVKITLPKAWGMTDEYWVTCAVCMDEGGAVDVAKGKAVQEA